MKAILILSVLFVFWLNSDRFQPHIVAATDIKEKSFSMDEVKELEAFNPLFKLELPAFFIPDLSSTIQKDLNLQRWRNNSLTKDGTIVSVWDEKGAVLLYFDKEARDTSIAVSRVLHQFYKVGFINGNEGKYTDDFITLFKRQQR